MQLDGSMVVMPRSEYSGVIEDLRETTNQLIEAMEIIRDILTLHQVPEDDADFKELMIRVSEFAQRVCPDE